MRSPIVVAGGHVPDHPRLLRPRPGRRLLPGLAFVALLLSAAADEPLVLTPTGISAGALQVQVTGQGARYFVDVSTNLVDWQEVHSAALTNNAGAFADPGVAARPHRFYRGRLILLNALEPQEVYLFSGDTMLFRVTQGPPGTAWVFKVNGVPGGNASVGTLLAHPSDPASFAYRAPTSVGSPFDVSICAEDPNDPQRVFCATVHVRPLPGSLVISPVSKTLKLGDQVSFQAGAVVAGIGYIPFNQVYWKINDTLGADPAGDAGTIDLDGTYRAPLRMPDSLPRPIVVGFSTTPEGAVLASSPIVLAALELTPPEIISVQAGPAGAVTPTLRKSDGSVTVPTPAQVFYQSGFPEAATVSANGAITVGNALGRAPIFCTDLATGATGSMVVESRPDVHVRLLSLRRRSPHDLNINPTTAGVVFTTPTTPIAEIEVTQPGALLNLTPDIYFFRGTTNLNTNTISGAANRALRFLGDTNLVRHFQLGSGVPATSDLVARIEERTGMVEFGNRPGSGIVTMEYNDGVIVRRATVKLTYSRLLLTATAKGRATQKTNEAFVSEWIELRPKLTNPGITDSRFMGATQVRIREQGNTFTVARMTEHTGFTVIPTEKEFIDTAEYVHLLPSGPSDNNPGPLTALGEILLYVRPHHTGQARFVIDVPTDPAIPPVELTMNINSPDMMLRGGYGGAIAGSPVPAHSYVDFGPGTNGPAMFQTPLHADNQGFGGMPWYPRDPLVWFVKTPGGETNTYSYRDLIGTFGFSSFGEAFPGVLRQAGAHQVWLAHGEHPAMRSAPLTVPVIAPVGDTFEELTFMTVQTQTNEFGDSVGLANQYAGFAIVSPTDGAWAPGVPVDVTVRLFAANGQPRKLGKKIIVCHRSSTDPDNPVCTTNYWLGGIRAGWPFAGRAVTVVEAFDLDPFGGASFGVPDENGFVHFGVTVDEPFSPTEIAHPAFVGLTLAFKEYSDFDLPAPVDLPVEYIEYLDGILVNRSTIPMAVARFVDPVNASLQEQYLRLDSHGVVAVPKAIPVASQRLRDSVTAGKLPPGSDQAVFELAGDASFVTAINGGQASLDLGEGLTAVNQQVVGDRLRVTVDTDLSLFEQNSGLYERRPITLTFPDGDVWVTEIQLFGFRLEKEEWEVDRNIPLNAAYAHFERGFTYGSVIPIKGPDGSVLVQMSAEGSQQIWGVDLELLPSLHACWDANRNGIAEPDEDLDADGFFTENDVAIPDLFRGVRPENPLVGFQREIDPETGAVRVRRLVSSLVAGGRQSTRIFADTTDHRRLERQSKVLGEKYDPDLIPDFVSHTVDAELLVARHGPNLFDAFFFSVYNFMAEQKADLPDPQIDFATVGGSRDAAYDAYTGLNGTMLLGNPQLEQRAARPLHVFVDHEATPRDFHSDLDVLTNFYPFVYYPGILDQKWQRRLIDVFSGGINQAQPLFADDRVRPYVSRLQGNPPTGALRSFFGVDLDGVLFDPTSINFPKPRFFDPVPVATFLLAQRVDENPNSADLRGIPVVGSALGDTSLTGANLLRRIGGTSGGFADLSQHHPGRLGVESKTPGADVPGLHAGFQFLGRPEQLIDPRNSLPEDDLRDVILKRDAATGNWVREARFFNTPAPRFVHGFAGNEDLKGPITTAAISSLRFAIVTDPPNVLPDDADTWKLRPHILVREQLAPDNAPDMVVATQSEGHEQIIKLAGDAVTDLAVDIGSAALLSAATGGTYLKACSVEAGKKITGAVMGFVVGVAAEELVEPYFGKNTREVVQFASRNRSTASKIPVEGVTFKSVHDLIKDPAVLPSVMKGLSNVLYGLTTNVLHRYGVTNRAVSIDVDSQRRIAQLVNPPTDMCKLLGKPFDQLKTEIKATFSAETFGGLGSAEAVGIKTLSICIPRSAQLQDGLYSVTYTVNRRIDIQPREPNGVALSALPWSQVFASYPYADVVSDEEFLRTVLAKRFDPSAGTAADQIWRAIQRRSVQRDVQGDRYQSYKIRAWQMPAISTSIAPFQSMGGANAVGDFVLTPNETEVPVSVGVGAAVSRSNENATSRARITTPGYEMVLIQGTLMSPRDPYDP